MTLVGKELMHAYLPLPCQTWIYLFENSVDIDQMASVKPAGQDPHCLPLCCKCMLITETFQVTWIKIGEGCTK